MGESHHRQELRDKLRAEMPPGVPEKILWRRRESANRRAFQFRVKHVHNDECSGDFPALLDDPERIAAV